MPEPRLTFIVDAKNLASREFKDLKRDLNSVERDAAKAGGGALGMAKALGPAKIAMIGLGVAGAGLALIAPMLGDTVEAASALNETLSKSKVVFGSAARGVEDFGDDAALSLGISKQAAVEAAATFGNLFVGLKLGEKPAADMSTRLVTLAGDLASFNNLDPTEVLEKLRFNAAVAHIYELANALSSCLQNAGPHPPTDVAYALREAAELLARIAAPMVPHLAEECWAILDHDTLIAEEPWPAPEKALLVEEMVTIAVQVNGKRRDELTIARDAAKEDIEAAALRLDNVVRAIGGRKIKKVVVVPQRIVNVVA